MQQLLFAPFKRKGGAKPSKDINSEEVVVDFPQIREFRVDNTVVSETFQFDFSLQNYIKEGKTEPLKFRHMMIKGFGIPPIDFTPSGMPSADTPAIKELTGNPDKGQYGKAYDHLKSIGREQEGKECCEALNNWLKFKQIETLLQTYIKPLQTAPDSKSRIHCSMNLNTETGRISSRKPNLQNQPALDKDKYKIRRAFVAEPGKKLIVADYGQLELRVLAHMTNCRGMIEAFKLGGDFHSRTALVSHILIDTYSLTFQGMYPEIQKELDQGALLLEWDNSKGKAPVPLLKDRYANERKKAKVMNFSIAYGKTVHGFMKDWNCSQEEASNTVDLWYSDRPEVKLWQRSVQKIAEEKGWTQTLLGRYRNLRKHFYNEDGTKTNNRKKEHGMRAAINTPI